MHFGTIPSSSMVYNEDTETYSCNVTALQGISHLRFAMASWGFVNVNVTLRTVLGVPILTFSTTSDGFSDVKYILIADNND